MTVTIVGDRETHRLVVRDYVGEHYAVFKSAGMCIRYTCPSHAHVVLSAVQGNTVLETVDVKGRDWVKQLQDAVESLIWICAQPLMEELDADDT